MWWVLFIGKNMEAKCLTVLLVYSHSSDKELIKKIMVEYGFDVTLVPDKVSATEEALQHKFDVMLVDIDLGGMEDEGLEVVSQIKQLCIINKTTPIMGITPCNESRHNKESKAVCLDGYINPPFKHTDANDIYSFLIQKHLQDLKRTLL